MGVLVFLQKTPWTFSPEFSRPPATLPCLSPLSLAVGSGRPSPPAPPLPRHLLRSSRVTSSSPCATSSSPRAACSLCLLRVGEIEDEIAQDPAFAAHLTLSGAGDPPPSRSSSKAERRRCGA